MTTAAWTCACGQPYRVVTCPVRRRHLGERQRGTHALRRAAEILLGAGHRVGVGEDDIERQ